MKPDLDNAFTEPDRSLLVNGLGDIIEQQCDTRVQIEDIIIVGGDSSHVVDIIETCWLRRDVCMP